MSDVTHAAEGAHGAHPKTDYVKIWAALCVLLVVSVIGPMFGIRALTLITAFGIAIVKAYMVARFFMHLNIEKRWVGQLLLVMVAFMVVMFWGISPDVMKHQGHRWENVGAKASIEKNLKAHEQAEARGEGGHH